VARRPILPCGDEHGVVQVRRRNANLDRRQVVIDNNGVHPPTLKSGTVNVAVGGYHDVLVRYYENTGGAVARVSAP
jgi:hypothetical protein